MPANQSPEAEITIKMKAPRNELSSRYLKTTTQMIGATTNTAEPTTNMARKLPSTASPRAAAARGIVARSAPTTCAPIQTGTVAAATNPASSDSAGKPEIETVAIVSPSFNLK